MYSFGFDGDDDQGRRALPKESDDVIVLSLEKPRFNRLRRKLFRTERAAIRRDWRNHMYRLEGLRDDGDIVHFEELPPMPDSPTEESKDRNRDDAPGASR